MSEEYRYAVIYTGPDGIHSVDSSHRTREIANETVKKREKKYGGGWNWRVRKVRPQDGLDAFTGRTIKHDIRRE